VTHPTAGFTVACEKEAGVAEVPQLLDVIFFDAGSVLFTTHRKHQARIEAILTARGYPADLQASALAAAEQVAQLANIQKHWFDTWAEEQVHWSRYYGALAAAMPDAPPSFADELFYLCHFVAHCTVYEDVHATLSELGQRYRLAVISNAYPSLDWVFDRLDLRRYFVHITLSAFAGCASHSAPSLWTTRSATWRRHGVSVWAASPCCEPRRPHVDTSRPCGNCQHISPSMSMLCPATPADVGSTPAVCISSGCHNQGPT
jgi:hypothetical protein